MMKFPIIRESLFFNLIIVLVSAVVSWFTFFMGAGHLVEAVTHPNSKTPVWEAMLGTAFYLLLCAIGLLSFWVMIGAVKGLYFRFRN